MLQSARHGNALGPGVRAAGLGAGDPASLLARGGGTHAVVPSGSGVLGRPGAAGCCWQGSSGPVANLFGGCKCTVSTWSPAARLPSYPGGLSLFAPQALLGAPCPARRGASAAAGAGDGSSAAQPWGEDLVPSRVPPALRGGRSPLGLRRAGGGGLALTPRCCCLLLPPPSCR